MEGGTLFNPGFLGGGFNWWIGQIADDSTWRDNNDSGKVEDSNQVPGWGKRYKVRIIGYHDKEEQSIPSDQLPWAQIMYPVTAGGGQAAATQTANLRQGMFVFGFFLDGTEGQNPVIMGVLGNNAQTQLSSKIGTDTANYAGTSGYAKGKSPDPNIKAPDDDLVITKPGAGAECAPAPAGVKLNKYGLRPDKPLTKQQLADARNARQDADAQGLSGIVREEFVQQRVSEGIKARCQQSNSAAAPAQPGATKESTDSVTQQSVADVKRQETYLRKVPISDPLDPVGSSLKSMRTVFENLASDIDKYLHTALSYVDAASSVIDDIQQIISNAACEASKYMKVIYDKILEYIIKTVQKALNKLADSMFPNQRYLLADLKELITQVISNSFSKLIELLCDKIAGFLNDALDSNNLAGFASQNVNASGPNQAPKVQICSVELLVGNVLSYDRTEIEDSVTNSLDTINDFLYTIKAQLTTLAGFANIGSSLSSIGGIQSNLASALNFSNISFNIFGEEIDPIQAVSSIYRLQNGGGDSEEAQLPRNSSVDKRARENSTLPAPAKQLPFAVPPKDKPDVKVTA